MSNIKFISDERMDVLTGKLATIFLGLTQAMLLFALLYRRYFLGQHEDMYTDLRIILAVSVFGYIGFRLYLGAVIPLVPIRTLLWIYLGFVVTLFVILSLWYGLPGLDNWQNTILPVVLGPAILIGGFWLIALLGKKRSDKSD